MKIVLTGGGTGGHVIPHLSLIPLLKNHFDKICYIGSVGGIEKQILQPYSNTIDYYELPACKLERDKSYKIFSLPFKLLSSVLKAKKLLKQISPQVVFSKGGYVSVPVCIAAKLLHIPIVSHESDLTLGLANKIIYKTCNIFCTTFEKTAQNKAKAVFTGAPIRKELFSGSKEQAQKEISSLNLNFNPNKQTLLIIGGSTGAKDLNEVVFGLVKDLTKKYNVVHIVGKGKQNLNVTAPNYYQLEFTPHIQHFLSLSDVVVSRAGSNAICELLALKKLMLLVPLPLKASRGDQIENANYFASLGVAKVLYQENLSASTLLSNLQKLENEKQLYFLNQQNPLLTPMLNGSKNIVNQILKATKYLKNKN